MSGTVTVTTPSDTTIQVTRTFEAPAELIFDFHTKPDLVSRWLLGPPGWSMPVCDIDLKVGGRYRYVWRNDENGHEFGTSGVYQEISAPYRIVHTDTMDGAPGPSLCTWTLIESNDRTTLTYLMDFGTREIRDQALQSGMTDGMGQSYDRLEAAIPLRA